MYIIKIIIKISQKIKKTLIVVKGKHGLTEWEERKLKETLKNKVLPDLTGFNRLSEAKAGASVIATARVYGKGKQSDKDILIAAQYYGLGKSAVLATDSIWRWRFSKSPNERTKIRERFSHVFPSGKSGITFGDTYVRLTAALKEVL